MADEVNIETEEISTPEGDAADVINAVVPDAEPDVQAAEEKPRRTKPSVAVVEANKKDAAKRQNDRDAGRVSLLDTYNKRAQELGFADVDSMFERVNRGGARPPKDDQRVAKMQDELEALRNENRKLSNTIRGLRGQISSLEGDMEISSLAYEAGVNGDDIDHAKSLLDKKVKRLSTEERAAFNVERWFKDELPKAKPSLFRAAMETKQAKEVQEVNVSSSPADNAGKAPSSKVIADAEAGQSAPQLATSMSRKDYLDRLRAMGIKNPAEYV